MKRRAPSLLSQLTRYILLFFTITVLFGGILLVQFSHSYRNDLKSMCQSHLESASAVLSRRFSEMQAQTSFLSGHTSVRQLLDSSYLKNAAWVELLRDDVLPVLDQANLGGQGNFTVRILHTSPQLPNLSDSFVRQNTSKAELAAFLDSLPTMGDTLTRITLSQSSSGDSNLCLYTPIYSRFKFELVGMVQAELGMESLFQEAFGPDDSPAFVADPSGDILWTGSNTMDLDLLREILPQSSDSAVDGRHGLLIVRKHNDLLSLDLYQMANLRMTGWPYGAMGFLLFGCLTAFFYLCTMAARVYRPFLRQMRALFSAMDKVRAGDPSARVAPEGNNELSLLCATFNDTLDNLQNLMTRLMEANRTEREAVYSALSNQIRPHFLNNALDRVRMRAHAEGSEEIALILERIMRYLSYNLGIRSRDVSLTEELMNISDYIEIYTLSRDTPVRLQIHATDGARGLLPICFLPKFTLLPIVENCLHHAFAHVERTRRIMISVGEDQGMLTLQVEDNGSGMEKEQLDALLLSLEQENGPAPQADTPGGNGIGLKIIKQRLEMYFARPVPFSVSSFPDIGTMVSFSIPMKPREEQP